MAGNFTEIGHVKKRRFLNEFARWGRVSKAADKADISAHSHYHWLRTDPEYVEAFVLAQEMAADVLEDEAVRRAVDGVDKPVYQKGEMVGVVREYSDTLLIFLLKGDKPAKFKERSEHSGSIGVGVTMIPWAPKTTEEQAETASE